MDIKGNSQESLVSVTSLLARVAVAKNQENRELIREPVPKDDAQEPVNGEKSPENSTVASTDPSDTNTNSQTTGRFVNVQA